MSYITPVYHTYDTPALAQAVNDNYDQIAYHVNGRLDVSNMAPSLSGTLTWVQASAAPVFNITGNADSIIVITQNAPMASGDAIIKITDTADQLSASGVLGGIYYSAQGASRTAPIISLDNDSAAAPSLFMDHSSTAHFIQFQASSSDVFLVEDDGTVQTPRVNFLNSGPYLKYSYGELLLDHPSTVGVLRLGDSGATDGPQLFRSAAGVLGVNTSIRINNGPILSNSSGVLLSDSSIQIASGGPVLKASGAHLTLDGSLQLESGHNISTVNGSIIAANNYIQSGTYIAAGTEFRVANADNTLTRVTGNNLGFYDSTYPRLSTSLAIDVQGWTTLTANATNRLALNGKPAVVSESATPNLKIVRGTCNTYAAPGSGARVYGEGFESASTGTSGVVRITFTTAFASVPCVTALVNTTDVADQVTFRTRHTDYVEIEVSETDKSFDFIAIGPR